jgi:hypothetical protein
MNRLFNRPDLVFKPYEKPEQLPGEHAFRLDSECPECQWAPPEDNPYEMYLVINRKGIKVILNYWVPANKERSSYIENKKMTKHIKEKIYPIRSTGRVNINGGQDWDETHCCPIHGEWTFENGWM